MSTSSDSSYFSYEPDYVNKTNNTQLIKVKMNNFTEADMTVVAERRLLTISAQHQMRWEIDCFTSRHYIKRFKLVKDANLNRISCYCKQGFLIIGVFRTGNTNPEESQPTSVNVEIVSESLARHAMEAELVERLRQAQRNPTGEDNTSSDDDIPSSSSATSAKRKQSSSSDISHDRPRNSSVNKAINLSGNADDAKTSPRSAPRSDSTTADDIRPTTSDHHSLAAQSKPRDETPTADATPRDKRRGKNRTSDATLRNNPSSANAIPPSNNPTFIIQHITSNATSLFNIPPANAGPRFNPTPNVMRRNNPTANARPRFNPIFIAAPRFILNENARHDNNPSAGSIPRFNNPTADGTAQLNSFRQPR